MVDRHANHLKIPRIWATGSAGCAPGRAAEPAAQEAQLRAWETDERLLNVQRRFQ
jgi:hypothetical protein